VSGVSRTVAARLDQLKLWLDRQGVSKAILLERVKG
jgi:hypothetical protein